jgi:acetyl-CoA C-acetyltransferase
MPELRKVAVIGGARIPFARSNTAYAETGNQEMLTAAMSALVAKFNLKGELLGEVAAGALIKLPSDWNLARESTLGAGLHPRTPAYDLQRACGTSLSAVIQMGHRIAAGEIDCAIAAGSDTASDVPLGYRDKLRRTVLRANRAKDFGGRIGPFFSLRPGDFKPLTPGTAEPRTGMSMGEHTEVMAKDWKVGRAEQDQLAFESHAKGAAAWKSGFFDDLVVPFQGLKVDNNLRMEPSLETMAKLRTAYDHSPQGTLTAANSTPLTDGAAAVLMGSEEWAKARGLPVLAYLTHSATAAVDFAGLAGPREGLLMAPTYAVPQMLDRAGIQLQDFDIYEIHEAFAAQVLCTLKAWESEDYCRSKLGRGALGAIDRRKMNPKGSSVALGHPFAATGARIVAMLAKQLAERGSGRGLISICTAGGMGVTAILER